jgi:NhaP-type Na+/H+ or K+/H+ antiporter
LLNQQLCDCFLDYGEITAEMAMLLAFTLFGAVLSGIIDTVDLVPALGLAALVVLVIRPSVLGVVLAKARMSWEAHAFVSWFGPRGLNSLLLALLVVQAGIRGSELLLATVGLVVVASVTVHGATATPFSAWYGRRAAAVVHVEEREGTAAGLFAQEEGEVERITVDRLSEMLSEPDPPVVLDVWSRSGYEREPWRVPGSVRVLPDEVAEWAEGQDPDRLVVAYCT